MNTQTLVPLEELFLEVLKTKLTEELTEDTPLESLTSFLFNKLFKKYGIGGIEKCYDSCHNTSLVFEIDEAKSQGVGGWFKHTGGKDLRLQYYRSKQGPESTSFPETTVQVIPGEKNDFLKKKAPCVHIYGPNFEDGWFGRKSIFQYQIFLVKMIEEDIFPHREWVAKKIKEFGVSVYGY